MNLDLRDCEIGAVSFSFPDLSIVFADVNRERYIYLDALNCCKVIFESDHVQNVVDGIFFFNSFDVFSKKNPFLNAENFHNYIKSDFDIDQIERDIGQKYQIICISALTGGDMFIVCETFDITFGG